MKLGDILKHPGTTLNSVLYLFHFCVLGTFYLGLSTFEQPAPALGEEGDALKPNISVCVLREVSEYQTDFWTLDSVSLYLTVSFFCFSSFCIVLPQPTEWRWQIRLQHFTANQIKDKLHWSRQVLLAFWAGLSVQMSPHRHHLPRLFTGQWQDGLSSTPPNVWVFLAHKYILTYWGINQEKKQWGVVWNPWRTCWQFMLPGFTSWVCVYSSAFVEADSIWPPDGQRPGQHGPGQEAHRQDHRDHLCLFSRTSDWWGGAATDY